MAKVYTIATWGLKGILVEVETNFSRHLPKIIVVGLPDASVQEAKERVWAAIENSGYDFPRQKVVINLSPAQIRKEGGSYDLPMAISVLAESACFSLPEATAFLGELSLVGNLNPIPGILVMVDSLKELGFRQVFVPLKNAQEAAIVKGIDVLGAESLSQVIYHLQNKKIISPYKSEVFQAKVSNSLLDFSDINGQGLAKRVLEIAAAGGHNVLMVGPPGAGKSMLSKAFLSILPEPTLEEALEVSKIHSLAGYLSEDNSLIDRRIIRSPHHSASVSAIIGGGSWPKPGEISLAHRNILFLDEILEFPRRVLEALRQPLEDKIITVSRVKGSFDFPANFILLSTANPCPCGYLTDKEKECHCSSLEIRRYQKRLSGPVLDRIDLHFLLDRVSSKDLSEENHSEEKSEIIKKRVIVARSIQTDRFKEENFFLNSDMDQKSIKKYCFISSSSRQILQKATDNLQLSARTYYKILKISRTIADLASSDNILDEHILEAIQYRSKILAEL